jgi:hypothetical protein
LVKDNCSEECMKDILDAFPSSVFICDKDLKIYYANEECRKKFGFKETFSDNCLCGDLICCVNALNSEEGCGTTEFCPNCVIRNSVKAAFNNIKVKRHLYEMGIKKNGEEEKVWFYVSGTIFNESKGLIMIVLEDVTEIVMLRKLLPICSYCHKIRDDKDYWHSLEAYFEKFQGTQFSHGICPDCLKKHFPDVYEKKYGKNQNNNEISLEK